MRKQKQRPTRQKIAKKKSAAPRRPASKKRAADAARKRSAAGLYSINALSEELSIDRRTLKKYLADLQPARIEGKSKLYRMEDVRRLIDGTSATKSVLDALRIKQVEEQTRECTARADLLEMDRKERAGELVPLSEVAAIVNPILLTVRQRFNSMPSELANLVNPTDPVHAQQHAIAWVERTLPMIRAELPQPKPDK